MWGQKAGLPGAKGRYPEHVRRFLRGRTRMSCAILGARRYQTGVVATGIVTATSIVVTATTMIVNVADAVELRDARVVISVARIVHDPIRLVSRA